MKFKTVYQWIAVLGILFCLGPISSLQAQKAAAKTSGADQSQTILPYCDEVIPAKKAEMQKDANENCKTVSTCVNCMERKSKIQICAALTVQPDAKSQNCRPVAVEKTVVEKRASKSRGTGISEATAEPFSLDVLQSVCETGGGTDLSVSIDNNKTCNDSNYSILWEIDGKKAGHEAKVECICGRSATVRVTDPDGNVVSRTIRLNTCGG